MSASGRAAAATALLAAVLLLCSCQAELWVEPDGSGRGRIQVLDATPGFGAEDLRRELMRNGFAVDALTPVAGGATADISWGSFERPFRRRRVNPDGTISLDFGPLDRGQATVHLRGVVAPGDSTGTIAPGGSSVVFSAPVRARLTYRPRRWSPYLPLIVAATALATTIAAALWFARRAGRGAAAAAG